MAAIQTRRHTPMRNLFASADKMLEERNNADYLEWKPQFEKWKKEYGEAFRTSYEAYCRDHGVEP